MLAKITYVRLLMSQEKFHSLLSVLQAVTGKTCVNSSLKLEPAKKKLLKPDAWFLKNYLR